MIDDVGSPRDLPALAVPLAGRLEATGDRWLPFWLVDSAGEPVEAVSAYFRDLQAAGRVESTLRSYGMDQLRWFRFLWAVDVRWERATRIEARDFCRWMLLAGKPARPHWRRPGQALGRRSVGQAYAPSVRAHSETVLRSFYDFCAMRRSVISPAQRGEMGGISLDLMAYLAPKGSTGTVACQETSGHAQAYGVTR